LLLNDQPGCTIDIHSVSVYETVEWIRGIFTLQYKLHYLQVTTE